MARLLIETGVAGVTFTLVAGPWSRKYSKRFTSELSAAVALSLTVPPRATVDEVSAAAVITGPLLSIWSVPVARAPQLPAASCPRTEKT